MSVSSSGDYQKTLVHFPTGTQVDVDVDLFRTNSLYWDLAWNYRKPQTVDLVGRRDTKRKARIQQQYRTGVKQMVTRMNINLLCRGL